MTTQPLLLSGRDIVCAGTADWDAELWTNQQHLMTRLATRNRVLFIESLGLRRPAAAPRDVRRAVGRLRKAVAGQRHLNNLDVLSPIVLPFHGSRSARMVNRRLLPRAVSRAAERLDIRSPLLWAYAPQAIELVEVLRPSLCIYHCVDDVAAQAGVHAASFRAAERRYVDRADLILASSRTLERRLRALSGRDVVYAPNVADVELFSTATLPGPTDRALAALPEPRIVFTGAVVATKLDLELLDELARLRPQWSIALVGPVGAGDPRTDVSRLRARPNIHLLGLRPYQVLPSVLRGAAAAIIPYRLNALTASVFPMKVYEYLAAGLPVVSTPLPSVAGVEGITFAADGAAMAAALDALLEDTGAGRRRRQAELARGHSWDDRLAEVDSALRDVLSATAGSSAR
jgi:glycosyltransferase involved in cell wall biosynthesis